MTDAHRAESLSLPSHPTSPRCLRIFLVTYWSLLLAFIALVLWKLLVGQLVIVWENPWLASIAFLATAFLLAYRYGRQQIIRNFLAPHSAFICPRCHYSLRALPDEGACPECGTSYTRASIVALWEHTYKLGTRYPRVSARTAAAAPPPAPPCSTTTSPWSKWDFPSALAMIEAGARCRGFTGARIPSLAAELDQACGKLARPLPIDLHAFLAAFDPAMWTRFIHTQPAPAPSQPASHDAALSAWIDSAPVVIEHIRIRPPAELIVATLAEHAATHPGARAFRDSLWTSNRSPAWDHTQLIAFADAHSGETLFYATDPPDLSRGSIITFLPSSPDRIWLADSLSQYLTRLAACDGVDVAFLSTNQIASVANTRLFASEFNQHNAAPFPHTAA